MAQICSIKTWELHHWLRLLLKTQCISQPTFNLTKFTKKITITHSYRWIQTYFIICSHFNSTDSTIIAIITVPCQPHIHPDILVSLHHSIHATSVQWSFQSPTVWGPDCWLSPSPIPAKHLHKFRPLNHWRNQSYTNRSTNSSWHIYLMIFPHSNTFRSKLVAFTQSHSEWVGFNVPPDTV